MNNFRVAKINMNRFFTLIIGLLAAFQTMASAPENSGANAATTTAATPSANSAATTAAVPAAASWTYPEINLLIDEPESMNPALETEIICYALPNGNSIEWTAGKRMEADDDWHFNIQHLRAQTEFLRQPGPDGKTKNYITVYLMAYQKAWNTWHRKHIDIAAQTYASMFQDILDRYAQYNPSITLSSHSGGGYLLFNYIATTKKINPSIHRLVFIDSAYGYETKTHRKKFTRWLRNKDNSLIVLSYEDSKVVYDGKNLVSKEGGTWGRSHKMVEDLEKAFSLRKEDKVLDSFKGNGGTAMEEFRSPDSRICFKLLYNKFGDIFHTVLVEKNGFIDSVLIGSEREAQGYTFWGERAYSQYIGPAAELKALSTGKGVGTGKSSPSTRNDKAEAAIDAFLKDTRTLPKAPDSIEVHSVMLIQHGEVLAARWLNGGGPLIPHVMHSVSKTLTAMAAGLAVSDGLLATDDKVISFFPDKLPASVSSNLADMTVRDLLTMNCGQKNEASAVRAGKDDWVQGFLAHPVPYKPGTWFAYNSLGTYMVSAIVQKVTGKKIVDYLDERVFQHIGIKKPVWDESPQGINCGGWGCYLTTWDMARIGQLLLDGGKWGSEQLLPEKWVADMTSFQVPTNRPTDKRADWTQGYDYFMWECTHDGVRADGSEGQYIILLPKKDAIIVLTTASTLYQPYLDIVWDKLYPALD